MMATCSSSVVRNGALVKNLRPCGSAPPLSAALLYSANVAASAAGATRISFASAPASANLRITPRPM
jgi:hypothetical protein